MNELESAYERNTFGVSRRTFMKLAGAAGVTAMGGMLVFPNEAHALYTEPENPRWEQLTGDKVRFTVHSDTHFNGCDVESKFPLAFQTIYENVPDAVAHIFDGDSTNNGAQSEYDGFIDAVNANLQAPPIICMGNHEMYAHGNDLSEAVATFKKNIARITVPDTPQAPGGTHEGLEHFAGKVGGENGYWVIAASCGLNYDYGYRIPSEGYDAPTPVQWMIQSIEAAVEEDPTKPVFLFTHHPMPETVHFSPESFGAGWIGQFNDDEYPGQYSFQEYLAANFPQVIHFSGHTHIPDNDPRSIWQGGFTAVQTATFGNNFWMEGGAGKDGYDEAGGTGGHPDSGYDASQCLLVEVDPANGHEVTIRRMDFREGAYIGRPWTFKVSDKSTWTYTHEAMEQASKAPVVDEGAQVEIPADLITSTRASFSIPASKIHPDAEGLEDDIVMSYRVAVRPANDPEGEAVYDACFMSDYYKASQNRDEIFTRELFGAALAESTEYLLEAYARNPWEKEAKIGEAVRFTTAAKQTTPLAALLAVDFSSGSAQDSSEFAHDLTEWGSPALRDETMFGKQVATLDGSSTYGYAFADDDFDKLAGGVTCEMLFKFNGVPSSKYWDLFSCGERTGHWIEYYPDRTLRYYFNDGSTNAQAAVEPNVWTHLTTTYDGSALRMYINGQLAEETAASGAIQPPNVNPYYWFIGADVSSSSQPQEYSQADVAFATLSYGTPPAADEVAAMYAAAAPCTITTPAADAFEGAETGASYTVPAASAVDVSGAEMACMPTVTDPDGTAVSLTQTADGAWTFTPAAEGDYSVTYAAGWSTSAPVAFTVALGAATDPEQPGDEDPETPDTDPEQPGNDDGDQGDNAPGDGDGAGSGNGTDGDGDPEPSGNAADGSNGNPDKGGSLPKTADSVGSITTAAGTLAAVATVALGAAGALSKKLGFSDSNSSQE